MPETHNYHHPKVEPYKHQEFPKVVYNHKRSRPSSIEERVDPKTGQVFDEHIPGVLSSKVVKDEDELKAALKAGFSEEVPQQHSEAAPAVEGEAGVAPKAPKKAKKGNKSEDVEGAE